MAKWIYFYKASSSAYSLSAPVMGFPLYVAGVNDYVLTQAAPGNSFSYRCYDNYTPGVMWQHAYVHLTVDDKNLINSEYNEGMSAYTGHSYEVLPNKLLRVDTEADLSSYGTEYGDYQISGRFLIKSTATGLPNACLIPVHFTVNDTIYDGFGNYDDSKFLFTNKSSYSYSDTSRAYNFMLNSNILPTKYLTKCTDNKVGRTDISIGDIIDFGDVKQTVPSVLKSWLDQNAEDVTNTTVSKPYRMPITTTGGIQLHTANRYSSFDIIASPVLQERTITENGIVTPDEGYCGIKKVDINVRPNLQEKTVTTNAEVVPDAGYDGFSKVIVNVEAGDSPLPIEVSTEADMDALLEMAEVGSVYKYTGESGTYENGALYVVEGSEEKEEDTLVGTWVFNDSISGIFGPADVSFTSNGNNYTTIRASDGGTGIEVYYDSTIAREAEGWYSKYQTINIIVEPTDEEFITWLKANATKQAGSAGGDSAGGGVGGNTPNPDAGEDIM